jgi:hypothetical protein
MDLQPVPLRLQEEFLEKILRSETFSRSEQLRRMVRWLAERSFRPHPVPPTEHEVASEVLHRHDFDPQTDSLVRKEMSRLREKLSRYYLAEGAQDQIRLHSGGGYLLRTEWATTAPPLGTSDSGRKCLLVLPLASDGLSPAETLVFLNQMHLSLTQDDRIELVSPTTARHYSGQPGDVREIASHCGADIVIEGSTWKGDNGFEAVLWIVNGGNGRIARSCRGGPAPLLDLSELLASQVIRSL